jgi:transposase
VALIARTFLVAGSVDRLKEEVKRLRRELRESNARRDHFQRVCAEQQATLAGLQEQMAAMQEQLALFKKALFAPRRERHVPSADQKLLFAAEACDAGADAPAAEADDEPPPARRRRQKRQRFVFPDFLPVKRVECPLTDDELAARFGPDGWRILKELVSRQIEVVPPQAYVVEEVRFVYAAKDSAAGVAPLAAEKRPSINPKGVFGPLAIAYLAEAKYGRHLPLYRIQEELLAATDTWFARSVLSGALLRPAERLLPLVELMHRRILQGDYASVDETPARVLRPGTGQVGRPYLWVYVGDPAHPYAVFDYRLDRSRAGPQAMLGDYSGAIMSDGYVVYESLAANSGNRLTDLGCWAHYPEFGFIWGIFSDHASGRVSLQRRVKIAPDNGEPEWVLRCLAFYAKDSIDKCAARHPRASRHRAMAGKRSGRKVHRHLHHLGSAISCPRSQ